ncbi:TssA family type VI secretion system protein [Pseudoalteromonas denitrificans]|uniref:Type VI secretion-associated protein, VC_A0119 family n=1 Tax=Pseudoalteromonas denitrificans DSM 6059 TaxID=1123010 RepID=A0A1I1NDH6_9GAMM|nr:TssA family type VI secretion system protein [Pseudoalteromonas denitrificans]SFC95679.1 type VI secretion-associated protein, VC_A0119 family [Pseudoalteromonas denitrificans DSM 6059]
MNQTHHTHKDWNEWLIQLTSPLTGSACGEDQLYEESFKYLKASSSGVADVDYKYMFEVATELLAEKSKDLRVASYLCLASAHEYGATGLQHALLVFNKLLADFSDVYPVKNRAKKSVHKWFIQQQDKLKALVELSQDASPEQWLSLNEEVISYNQISAIKLDCDAGPLSKINDWLDLTIKQNPVVAVPVEKTLEKVVQKIAEPLKPEVPAASAIQTQVTSQSPSINTAVDSDAGFMESARALISFDKEKENYARMITLARAIRWGSVLIPPNEAGKTRLPEPRDAAFAPIKNALANEHYIEAFLKSEALFMEGAMHFNLDLQFLSLKALKGMGQNKLVNNLTLQICLHVEANPQLINLKYDSGKPFCSQGNKETLEKFKNTNVSSDEHSAADPWQEIESEIFDLCEADKLTQAMEMINTLPANHALDRAKTQLLQARTLLKCEQAEFAKALLIQLLQTVETQRLAVWQPELALQVWRYAVQCFSSLGDESHLDEIYTLKQKMLVLDPAKAIAWC